MSTVDRSPDAVETTRPSSYDAIIVGSGLGGLTSAAYLAAAGRRVLLLERYDVLGGSSHVFRRHRKWEFDVGVHYIGDCGDDGLVPSIMRGVGLDDRIEWLPLEEKAVDTVLAPGFALDFPHGWDEFIANQLAAFPNEQGAIRRYLSVLRRIGEAVDVSETLGSRSGMVKLVRRTGLAAGALMMPVAAFQLACGLSPEAMMVNSVHLGAVATTPDVAPCCCPRS
ncbi:phytoene desaturase family protein [Tsukamurella soli]|uniref:phytoene desaturase family protein n=1 Tax=Tsukamurella soli TaxID=644556 RepID=UPI00361B1CF3